NFLADVSPSSTVFEISPKLPHKTIDALRQARGLKIGSTTAKGAIAISGAVAAEILGLDGKVISGYGGKKDLTLAVARGEVDIMVTSDSTAMKDEKDGYVVNLFTLGSKRSPAIPDVPSMTELGASPPKDLEAALAYVSAGGMSVALPPEVAPERVDYLRNAFQRLGEDKEVQKDIEQVTGIWRPFVSGKDLQDTVSTIKANNGLAGQLDEILAKRKATQ
ncbi:MAG: hypothetical protein HYY30_01650, partial [Chloroflexi bacterium]|nr:hypothetical protein [Chloroflexota bacterium]